MEQPTSLALRVEASNRMSLKLPRKYFGNNATLNVVTETVVGDLMTNPLGFAANKVREVIENTTKKLSITHGNLRRISVSKYGFRPKFRRKSVKTLNPKP